MRTGGGYNRAPPQPPARALPNGRGFLRLVGYAPAASVVSKAPVTVKPEPESIHEPAPDPAQCRMVQLSLSDDDLT